MSTRGWRYWCAYAVMIAPNAAVGLTLAAMPPILPELAARVGSDRAAQLVTSVSGFGMIVGGLFSGRLLERIGIRNFTLASLVIYGAFGTLCWFLSSALTLGLSRFVLGMGGVFFSTAALALTAATFTGEARSRVIGLQQATSQVVNVCAVFIVGALVAVTGWRGAFLLYGAFAVLLFVLALLGVSSTAAAGASGAVPGEAALGKVVTGSAAEKVVTGSAAERAVTGSAAGINPASANATRMQSIDDVPTSGAFLRRIAPVCALTTLMGILTVIPMAQLPFVLADNGQGSPQQVSLVLGVNFVFAAISAMSFARLSRLFGKPATFMAGLTCGMVGIALMGLTHGIPWACAAGALAGLGTGIYNTYVFDHGVEISPPVYHGRAAGLLFAFMFFGAFINPLVAGVFTQFLGLHNAFPAMAAVAVLCGLAVIL